MKDVIDADRPFLEQFEEKPLVDDEALEWLIKEVYEKPERLDVIRQGGKNEID